MAAYAGYFPGSNDAVYNTRGNARSIIQGRNGMEYDLSSGWHPKRPEGWQKGLKREQVEMVDFQGKVHKVYRYNIPDSIIGFHAHNGNNAQRQSALALLEDAFSDKDRVISVEGCGHIKQLEYVEKSHILRVTFYDGTICAYFDVPSYVAGRLFYFAHNKTPAPVKPYRWYKGQVRHKLGVEFWDLIRIRGHHYGAKFPFEYVAHGTAMVRTGSRHLVKLRGDKYITSLSEAEFKQWALAEAYLQSAKELKNKAVGLEKIKRGKKRKSDDLGDDNDIMENDLDQYDLSEEDQKRAVAIKNEIEDLKNTLSNTAIGEMLNGAETYINDILNMNLFHSKYGDIISDRKAREAFVKGERENIPELNMLDARTGKLKQLSSRKEFYKHEPELSQFDKEGVYSWFRKGDRQRGQFGKIWTTQMLKDLANPSLPDGLDGSQYRIYKQFIDSKDWRGAFNFLKGAKRRKTMFDRNTQATKMMEAETFAGPQDELAMDIESDDKED